MKLLYFLTLLGIFHRSQSSPLEARSSELDQSSESESLDATLYSPGVFELKDGNEVGYFECRLGVAKDPSDYCYKGTQCPPCWQKVTNVYVCYNKEGDQCPSLLGIVDISQGSVKVDPYGNKV